MKRWAMGLLMLLGMGFGLVCLAADFDGDGIGDIAVFRASVSLWSVRNVTRFYFGSAGDAGIAGDFDGSGTDRAAIFRQGIGLWSVRDLTRTYLGSGGDEPKIGDYNGDGTEDFGIFRPSSGLWVANGITRIYFGSSIDQAISPGKARAKGLLKTGQTNPIWGPDDGAYQKGIAFSYTDNGDGTITDNATGLMWPKDGHGAGCNFGNQTDWYSAIDWADYLDFAGYSDWRLPNLRELQSLINYGYYGPAINYFIFPNTHSFYWSSTAYANGSGPEWYMNFYDGSVSVGSTFNNYEARAVRGGE